jgi:PST family polysaccharide transporter
MSFKQKTLSGIGWTASANIVKQIFLFLISVVLARLLMPEDFGLVGMIIVFTGFAGIFAELGFGAALIQKKEIEENHLSSVFWLNILAGIVLTAIVLSVAPLIAKFYKEPRLKLLTMFISINFLLGSLNIVHRALLTRSMDFRRLAIIETTTMTVAGTFAIIFALIGFGVWSLVWHMIISTSIGVIMIWQMSSWRPQFCFDKNAIKELFGFSGNLLGFSVFNYWVRNSDDLLIGKFIGSAGLGVYSRAYSIMLIPLNHVSATVGKVMFPAFSRIQDDKVRVKQIYLRTIGIIALVTFPMMMGLLVVADSFVLGIFGYKWKDVIPVLRIFALLGMVQSIATTVGWIYASQGRTDWQLRWGIFAGGLLILSIVIGIIIGTIKSVALCYVIMSGVILVYPNFAIPGKLIDMTFAEVVHSLSGIFGCAFLMSVSVYLIGMNLPSEWPHLEKLIIQVSSGITFYILLVHLFKLKAYVEIKELLWQQWGNYFQKAKSYD